MEKLARSLNEVGVIHRQGYGEVSEREALKALQTAAEEFAVTALRTYTGDRLRKALAVSAAISELLAEDAELLEEPEVG